MMSTTDLDAMPTSGGDKTSELPVDRQARGPRWLLPVVVVAAIAVVAGVVTAILLLGDDGTSPEDVVVDSLEAYNAHDIDALEALYDPEIVVTYDLSPVGGGEMPDDVGREAVLGLTEQFWEQADPTLTYEVIAVDGGTVTTSETGTFPDGSSTRSTTTYRVSDAGLIARIDHIIEE